MEMERTSALSFGRLGRFGGRAIIAWFEGQQTRPEAWADPPFDHDRQTETRRYNQQGEQRGQEQAANDGYPHRRTPCRIARKRNRRGNHASHHCDGGHGNRLGALVPRSEEHTSELQSLMRISSAVYCLKKNIHPYTTNT